MTAEIDVIVEDLRWTEALDLGAVADAAAGAVAKHLSVPFPHEIALLAASDARIMALNADFRGKPAPTNVLSWPSNDLAPARPGSRPDWPAPEAPDLAIFLGDIALAYETCAAEAVSAEKTLKDHATHLIVHGILHLLGYDHEADADADLMEGCEVAILEHLGIASPYEEDG